jgi:hypothetical protein
MLDAIGEPLGYRQLNELWRTVRSGTCSGGSEAGANSGRRGFAVR